MTIRHSTIVTGDDPTHIGPHVVRRAAMPSVLGNETNLDLARKLRSKPELVSNRSMIIEMAVEEFGMLRRDSPSLSLDEYCGRFNALGASISSSIYRQLEVEQYVGQHSVVSNAFALTHWPVPGTQWCSFNVIEKIGQGALARVYLCSQPSVGNRQVVVKVSRSNDVEADALGRLRHPHIVPILSLEKDPRSDMTALSMPFLGRSTLYDLFDLSPDRRVRNVRSDILRAARMWEQPSDLTESTECPPIGRVSLYLEYVAYVGIRLADALAQAHSRGILHGDIKPSNVLLSCDGAPLLMDFNLSGNRFMAVSARGGTLPYMPPEQVRSIVLRNPHASEYDARSDVFSLGVLLYEAISGRPPFPLEVENADSDALAQQLLQRQKDGFVPLKTIGCGVSPSLAAVIEQSLAFRPDNRPQSAEEIRDRIEAEFRPIARLKRRARARPRLAGFGGAAIVLAATLLTAYALTLPPKHVRLYSRAVALAETSRYADAERVLQESLTIDPDYADARFALGRVLIARNELVQARETFFNLSKLEKSPRSAAYVAYCFGLRGDATSAIPWYELAQEWGCNAAEVHNNLAYSYEIGGSRYSQEERLAREDEELKKALMRSPKMAAARVNRVCFDVRKAAELSNPIPRDTLVVCRNLAKEYPKSDLVLRNAALAFAYAAKDDSGFREEGVQYLEQALSLNAIPWPDQLPYSTEWESLRDSPRFQSLVKRSWKRPVDAKSTIRINRLVEPLSLAENRHGRNF